MKPLIGLPGEVEHSDRELSRRRASLALNYSEAVRTAGGVPVILPLTTDPTTLREYLNRCDAFVLPGGGDVSPQFYNSKMSLKRKKLIFSSDAGRDQMEIYLIRESLTLRKPILGICRGIQIMNVATGGTLIVDIPTEATKPLCHRLPQGDAEHEINITAQSKLHRILGARTLPVNSKHHQAIDRIGKGWRVTGRSLDGIIEALEQPNHPFAIGLQCHPERLFQTRPEFRNLFKTLVSAALR